MLHQPHVIPAAFALSRVRRIVSSAPVAFLILRLWFELSTRSSSTSCSGNTYSRLGFREISPRRPGICIDGDPKVSICRSVIRFFWHTSYNPSQKTAALGCRRHGCHFQQATKRSGFKVRSRCAQSPIGVTDADNSRVVSQAFSGRNVSSGAERIRRRAGLQHREYIIGCSLEEEL